MSYTIAQDSDLLHRRKRDYILLLVMMVLSFVGLGPMNIMMPSGSLVTLIFSIPTTVAWYFICFRITVNFYESSLIRWFYGGLLVFQLNFNGYVHYWVEAGVSELILAASVGYVANLIGFGFIFYILLKDIFKQRHDLSYSLLGATNIYLLIPILFTYVYCLLAVHDPASIDADPNEIMTVLLSSFNYSWHVLAGVDYQGKVSEGLALFGVLESLAGNLFVVFIIGRLMTK